MKKESNLKNKRFIQHNLYFIAWLINTKEVTIEKASNGAFFILDLDSITYKLYKEEYKVTHRELLKKINRTVKDLKSN